VENRIHVGEDILVDTAGWEAGDGELVSVADVDEGVWNKYFLDMVEDIFFLFLVRI
jgi:hypothetical protein